MGAHGRKLISYGKVEVVFVVFIPDYLKLLGYYDEDGTHPTPKRLEDELQGSVRQYDPGGGQIVNPAAEQPAVWGCCPGGRH